MLKRVKEFLIGFILMTSVILIMIFGIICKENTFKKETKQHKNFTDEVVESIKDKYNHDVCCFSQSENGKIKCYYAYWTVPKVTVHLDGTETTKDMVQVHRYNTDGEYTGMVVAYTLEDAMDLFDKNI